jgi:hypothetical protein
MKWLKVFLVWCSFIPLAILNGGLREYVLCQFLPDMWAMAVSGILLSVVICVATYLLLSLVRNLSTKDLWLTGIWWFVLTVSFEFAGGIWGGVSMGQLLSAYNPLSGNLWILVLLATMFAPVTLYRRKSK